MEDHGDPAVANPRHPDAAYRDFLLQDAASRARDLPGAEPERTCAQVPETIPQLFNGGGR